MTVYRRDVLMLDGEPRSKNRKRRRSRAKAKLAPASAPQNFAKQPKRGTPPR